MCTLAKFIYMPACSSIILVYLHDRIKWNIHAHIPCPMFFACLLMHIYLALCSSYYVFFCSDLWPLLITSQFYLHAYWYGTQWLLSYDLMHWCLMIIAVILACLLSMKSACMVDLIACAAWDDDLPQCLAWVNILHTTSVKSDLLLYTVIISACPRHVFYAV